MAAGATYTPIATTSPSSGTSYSFTSIPSTYTDLIIVASVIVASGAPDLFMTFNSDTATNYSTTYMTGNGTAASSGRYSNATSARITNNGVPNTTAGGSNQVIQIQNYANTTTYKTAISRANNTTYGTDAHVSLWRSGSAITTITLTLGSSTFAAGSTFTLYGIAAA